jgi:hypothetical protein
VLELTFVAVAVNPAVHTVTMWLPQLPFANITVPLNPLPQTRAVLLSVLPFAIVALTTLPLKLAFTIPLTPLVLPQKVVAVGVNISGLTVLLIVVPPALVDPTVLVQKNAYSNNQSETPCCSRLSVASTPK